jgi:hypothetical protein
MIYSAVDWIATPHPPMAALTSGCGNGTTFCPGDPLLRGQLAVFLARGMILPSATVALNDVSPSDPLYPYIAAVVQNNVMLAPGGTFGPNQPVTRGELADALANSILYAMPKTGNLLQLTNCVPYPSFPCP